eukprot:15449171-Alexandrium_andersonii.AAC.2
MRGARQHARRLGRSSNTAAPTRDAGAPRAQSQPEAPSADRNAPPNVGRRHCCRARHALD